MWCGLAYSYSFILSDIARLNGGALAPLFFDADGYLTLSDATEELKREVPNSKREMPNREEVELGLMRRE